eukprot:gb/GFBE01079344.1/.p1 GENE.gb/GFBE01079344.1/~~gb/GFBE01079344.1/.p1  ORF type:complete len:205 (+),score=26.50 gb/GFBE01079344.1/:1-615(+)
MVSLQVPTARFGAPPDPEKPEPHYPGIPFRSVDALGALKVYRENLKKDRDIRASMLQLQRERPGPILHERRGMDMMPGLGSVTESYLHMGFTVDPITKRMVPPEIRAPPVLEPHECLPTPSVRSRASSTLVRSGASAAGSSRSKLGTSSGATVQRSSSVPEGKSHFAAPQGGVCCWSQKDKELLEKEKAMIHKNCGQNRVFCFV